MGARGKKSGEALALAGSAILAVERPDAPYDLTDEESREWWAVVDRMPADWFPRETHGLLAQYCRHIVAARHVATMIRELETAIGLEAQGAEDRAAILLAAAKPLDRLLKMQDREGRAISSLATRMRISQQASYDKTRKKGDAAKRPWDGY